MYNYVIAKYKHLRLLILYCLDHHSASKSLGLPFSLAFQCTATHVCTNSQCYCCDPNITNQAF